MRALDEINFCKLNTWKSIVFGWLLFFTGLCGTIGLDYGLRLSEGKTCVRAPAIPPYQEAWITIPPHGLPEDVFAFLILLTLSLSTLMLLLGTFSLWKSQKNLFRWIVIFLLFLLQIAFGFFIHLLIILYYVGRVIN